MARLNPKDLELTLTGKTVDLSDPKNAFLGGEFLTNSRDYIEVLISILKGLKGFLGEGTKVLISFIKLY